ATRSLIREGKTHQLPTIVQTGQKLGMQSLDQNLKDMVMQGIISERAALEKANHPDFIVRGGEEMLDMGGVKTGTPPTVAPSRPAPPPPEPSRPAAPPPRAAAMDWMSQMQKPAGR
ncbi:hypothetical protein HY256_12345, partial [Candidatus Sumerlaeota bacterium]|nr:hypothetical protein [Candidatus Sumerlaeota bacterium]